jgi:hypothetical protein
MAGVAATRLSVSTLKGYEIAMTARASGSDAMPTCIRARYAYTPLAQSPSVGGARWLRGDSLPEGILDRLGVVTSDPDSDEDPEGRARRTVLALCRLASPLPFVFFSTESRRWRSRLTRGRGSRPLGGWVPGYTTTPITLRSSPASYERARGAAPLAETTGPFLERIWTERCEKQLHDGTVSDTGGILHTALPEAVRLSGTAWR